MSPEGRTPTGEHLRAVDVDEKRVEDPPPLPPPPREHKRVMPEDTTDMALLPRHVRMIAFEVRDLVELVRGVIVPALRRIEERQSDMERHAAHVERSLHARINELQAQIQGTK